MAFALSAASAQSPVYMKIVRPLLIANGCRSRLDHCTEISHSSNYARASYNHVRAKRSRWILMGRKYITRVSSQCRGGSDANRTAPGHNVRLTVSHGWPTCRRTSVNHAARILDGREIPVNPWWKRHVVTRPEDNDLVLDTAQDRCTVVHCADHRCVMDRINWSVSGVQRCGIVDCWTKRCPPRLRLYIFNFIQNKV